jgi:hypothetical protein
MGQDILGEDTTNMGPYLPSAMPTVPSIASVPASVDSTVDKVAAQASAPLPSPYTTGAVPSKGYVKDVPQYTPKNTDNKPLGSTRYDIKQAEHKNAWAELSNSVGGAVQHFEQQKQDQLKTKLVDVMQAKQNIHNAESVLAMDDKNFGSPEQAKNSKAQAQAVLVKNKSNLETVLNGKDAKQLAKALDISYVDPEKNKKPEIQTGIAAAKEFKSNGPFNAANPQEAAVAKMSTTLQSTAPKPDVKQESRADAALAKDSPALQTNPEYIQAIQDRKEYNQYIVPKLIEQQTAITEHQITEEIAQQKDDAATGREMSREASALRLRNIEEDGANKREAMSTWATLSAARMRSDDSGKQMAKDVYNQASSIIKDLTKSIVDTRAQIEKMDKDKTNKKDTDTYDALKTALTQYQTQIQEQQTQQFQANLIMQGDPQAHVVSGLLGGIQPAIPASK